MVVIGGEMRGSSKHKDLHNIYTTSAHHCIYVIQTFCVYWGGGVRSGEVGEGVSK